MNLNAKSFQQQSSNDELMPHFVEETRMSPRPQDPNDFGKDQVRLLVRQVFFQDSVRAVRQVVFTAMHSETEVGKICELAGESLAKEVSAKVCVAILEEAAAFRASSALPNSPFHGGIHEMPILGECRHISDNLWLSTDGRSGLSSHGDRMSALHWRARVTELRRHFEYAVIHGPTADHGGQLCALGQMCDGVVLVVEANSTRRMVAQKLKEKLHAANVPLLGIVLNNRIFPIPWGLYRRL